MKKRIISFATGLALMSSIIAPIAALADEETTTMFSYETYSVSYEIKSSWDNNQIIEITLTNTGDEPILNWALEYDAEGEINGIWNSDIYDSNESSYVIKNSGYNYEILPEDSVTFGYTLTGDELDIPESITLCSQREDVDAESYSVSLSVSDDWGSGFNGLITIENLSDRPIEAWRLGFDANFEISSVWNAQMLSSDYNSYSLCSDITTTPIGAGETKTFGFAAVKDQDSIPEITNTSLSEVAINADLTDHNDDSSEIDDSSSEYSDDSSSENDDSSETDSSDVSSEPDSSDESSEYEEPVVRPQTYTYEVRNEDCAVDEITISMETAGDLEGTTTVESIMDKDVMCSGVVGLFGEPFDIETSAEFSSAVLTFKVDKSMLGDTEFDNLLFLWYDEENENFVELDTEHDEENSTVSTTVTHFSKYMLVDGLAWYTNWQMISKEMVDNGLVGEQSLLSKPSVAIGIPTVYSDSSSDPVTVNEDGSISCKRIDAFRYIYESLSPGQNYSLNFSIYGSDGYIHAKRLYCDELENDGLVDKYLNDLGFEDWEERSDFFLPHLALYTYADYNNTHFDVAIILISDDYHLDDMYTVLLNSAHDNRFVFIDMRDVTDQYLINRAEATGGLYMKYSDHAMNYLSKILRGEARFEDYDNDGDGFSDLEEKRGLIYDQAGNKVKTYWQFEDTDNDELDDNEEVDVELTTVSIPGKCGNPDTIKYYHKMHSNPMLKDTDGDGYWDDVEINEYHSDPKTKDVIKHQLKQPFISIDAQPITKYNSDGKLNWSYYGDTINFISYGGRQQWFYDIADEIEQTDNTSFGNYITSQIIGRKGCGLISMSDILIYLKAVGSIDNERIPSINGLESIDIYEYVEFVNYINDYYCHIETTTGDLGPLLCSSFNCFFELNNCNYNATWGVNGIIILNKILEMLDNNIPVTLSIGPGAINGVPLYIEKSECEPEMNNKSKFPSYIKPSWYDGISNHYVTVTGVIKDSIINKVYLQISSYGEKYYIDYDEYMNYKSTDLFDSFSNIMYITRK